MAAPLRENAKHREAFELWYQAGRSCVAISQRVSVDQRTLFRWADAFRWHDLADRRDNEAQAILDRKAVEERVKRIEQQRIAGSLMRQRGTEYYAENKISEARDATAAIKAGIDIERAADGLPSYVMEILTADENDLRRRAAELDARRRAAMALDTGEAESDQSQVVLDAE